ncbi:arylamine N-acetyltransferase family protein [Novosphingobium sp. JCM 18896]|uniref:arylamine N-acetyltransferase family protein n=1 Tax=Novosphingobium sp. JCM 18896 TaxID=2989731 RepID=UPI002221FCF1|nr:arylamine N-acetyltransferase [Novosphingobium sp. JCM 18896]MCW1431319.1 arylamine N-acetyltransferase [Novosphingobium sp. JCM 18896]
MTTTDPRLASYLDRIGRAAVPTLDAAGLLQVLAAHRQAIAFENLDIPLGRGIAVDGDSVFDKLVARRRGGYCFEQNRLFSDMLAALGFANRPLLARVWLQAVPGVTPPRTHVLLLVDVGGEDWIADAGFGGSFVPPLRLVDGAEGHTPDGAAHRLRRLMPEDGMAGEWLLERAGPVAATDGRSAPHEDWQPQYSFELGQVAPIDLEQANHWTSTRAETRFTTLHVVSRVLPDGFAAMSDRRLTIYRGGETEFRAIEDAAEYATTLRDVFGLDIPASELTRLRIFAG